MMEVDIDSRTLYLLATSRIFAARLKEVLIW